MKYRVAQKGNSYVVQVRKWFIWRETSARYSSYGALIQGLKAHGKKLPNKNWN